MKAFIPPQVLLSCGSFNPPTKAHMEMFARARQALLERGEQCVLGVMSPVNDAYKKPGLAPASHRLRMCALAAADYPWIAVDPWESQQDSYRRTMFVIRRLRCVEYVITTA